MLEATHRWKRDVVRGISRMVRLRCFVRSKSGLSLSWQPHMERTPHANLALRPDGSPMQFYNAFADRQSQSQAIDFSRETGIEAMKVLKDPLKLLWWDAYAVVAHAHLHHLLWLSPGGRGPSLHRPTLVVTQRSRLAPGLTGENNGTDHHLDWSPLGR